MTASAWARASPFVAHESLIELIDRYVRHRDVTVRRVVDLWAPSGELARSLSMRWSTARVLALYPDDDSYRPSRRDDDPDTLSWGLADSGGPGPHLDPAPDVVVGIPPWRWNPRRLRWTIGPDAVAELTDDPANAALLEAGARLPRTGLGFFVVESGFLMRHGPETAFAQFEQHGLHVDGAISLPRGNLDHTSGRVLLIVGRTPPAQPIFGQYKLTPDSIDQLLRSPS